ncbi:MAG: PqqD family peptide modification chaperone [Firmicutes bacterium]|nr:PqqD family peptide modification chaperone [Bacillota bacterium]
MSRGHPARKNPRGCPTEFQPASGRSARSHHHKEGGGYLPSVGRGISPQSVVCAANEQIFCELAGEATILNLKNGVYYGLDRVGTRIWTLLQQARRVQEIRDALLEEYEVTVERCERDLLALLEQLSAEGLIEIRDESAA